MASPNERRRRYRGAAPRREEVVVLRDTLRPAEADNLLKALWRARDRRANGCLHSDRHAEFATQDLPAGELSARAFAWTRRVLRERVLAPVAERCGLEAADLYFKDLFFVVYDADSAGGQRELALHHDGSLFSFNVLLSDPSGFEGGGTLFPELGAVQIGRGDAVVHDGKVLHGGAPVTSGQRVILVGFVESIVTEEPLSGETPGHAARREAAELAALREREAPQSQLAQSLRSLQPAAEQGDGALAARRVVRLQAGSVMC